MRGRSARDQSWAKRNGDFICIAVVAGLFTAFAYLIHCDTVSPPPRTAEPFNFGFGKNVDCEFAGFLEPVCTPRRRPRKTGGSGI
jgi:hypothetical protein